uniref:Cadherin domain-containing protein n=1 Tax=Trichogramma kaykai TaxID=54128 RepID=A0ABD2XD63_9HYME
MSILAKFTVLLVLSAFLEGRGLYAAFECQLANYDNINQEEWTSGLIKISKEDHTKASPMTLVLINLVSTQTGVIDITDTQGIKGKNTYFGVSENKTTLESGFYEKFEEQEDQSVVYIDATITCKSAEGKDEATKKIKFELSIVDSNNHVPTFVLPDSEKEYTFKLPMPIPAGFDLSNYGKIIVRDADLTNDNISLALDSDNKEILESLSIKWAGKDPSDVIHKRHLFDFTALKSFDLNETVTFTLKATDSGTKDDPKTLKDASTKLTFVVDQENSYPKFDQVLYTADISKVNKSQIKDTDLTSHLDKPIVLSRGNLEKLNLTVEAITDLEFKASVDKATRKVKILLTKTSTDQKVFLQKNVLLKLSVTDGKFSRAESWLKITLPDADSETPVVEDDGRVSDGYRVATIILSLIIVGLMIYIIYPLVKHIRLDFWNR